MASVFISMFPFRWSLRAPRSTWQSRWWRPASSGSSSGRRRRSPRWYRLTASPPGQTSSSPPRQSPEVSEGPDSYQTSPAWSPPSAWSSPVTRDTVVTQTLTEQIKITFRNIPTLTTLTSTKLVSTQVTSFVTKTERVVPTANPLAGLLG